MSSRKPLFAASCAIVQPLVLNAVSIPATAYIIRTLGPADYGFWAVAMALVAMFQFIGNLGLRAVFVRTLAANPDSAQKAFSEQLALRLALAAGAGILAMAVCLLLGYPRIVLACTALSVAGFVLSAASLVVADLLQAQQRLPAAAAINLASGLLLTASAVTAMWFSTGPVGLSAAYLAGPLTSCVVSLLVVKRSHFPVRLDWDLRRFRELLRESRALGASICVSNLSQHIEALLVPKLVGIVPYAYFSAGYLPASRLEVVPDGIGSAFYPVIVRRYNSGALA